MNLKILTDGTTKLDKFLGNWGLAILIDETILFDTFGNPKLLLKNIKKMKIDIYQIQKIVISHLHWDHISGLEQICKLNPGIEVLLPEKIDENIKIELESLGVKFNLETSEIIDIAPNVFKSKAFKIIYKEKELYEQFLILRNNGNISVLVGCSHPGIYRFLDYVKKEFEEPIDMVIGGFHLINESKEKIEEIVLELARFNIKRIAPMHCSGNKAKKIIKKIYGDKFVKIKDKYEIEV